MLKGLPRLGRPRFAPPSNDPARDLSKHPWDLSVGRPRFVSGAPAICQRPQKYLSVTPKRFVSDPNKICQQPMFVSSARPPFAYFSIKTRYPTYYGLSARTPLWRTPTATDKSEKRGH